MYALPVTDTLVLAIDDSEDEDWVFHFVEFDPTAHHSFRTPHGGQVLAMTVNPKSHAAWIVAAGQLYASSREMEIAVPLPLPVEGMVPFDVTLIGDRYYVCGNASNIWYYDVPREEWVPLVVPEPRPELPPRQGGETAESYTRRTSPRMYDHARRFPDMYRAFPVGQESYFCGALGRVIRLKDGATDEQWLETGPRLVHGFDEDGAAVLCGDDPVAGIYRGTIDEGFEQLFQDDNPALHLTARHGGTRYIGAGLDPDHEGPCLFTLEDGELAPVETGCEREPEHLTHLKVTGSVLWATDLEGIFRLKDGRWRLTEIADLA